MDLNKFTKKRLIAEVQKLLNGQDNILMPENPPHVESSNYLTDPEKSFNRLFEESPDMLFILSPDGKVNWVNKTGAKTLGYTNKELLGQSVWKVVHKDNLEEVKNKLASIIKEKKLHADLFFYKVKKDGTRLYVHEKTQLEFNEHGKINEIRIICQDITKAKFAEDALKLEEEKYRSLTHHLNVGIYRSTTDDKGNLLDFNLAFMKMFGFKNKKELYSLPAISLYAYPEDRKNLMKVLTIKGSIRNREIVLVRKDGSRFIGSITAVFVKDKYGNKKYYGGIVEDITDRKKAERALIDSEFKYRTLIESFGDIVFITDYDSKMIYANPALQKQTGFTIRDFQIHQKDNPFIHPDDASRVGKLIADFARSRKIYSDLIENRFIDKKGEVHWYSSVISKIEFENKPALQFIVRDITKQKEDIDKLLKSEEQYRTLFNFSPDGILIENLDGTIIDVNPAFCKLMGYTKDELVGQKVHILSTPEALNRVNNNIMMLKQGKLLKHVEKSLKKDGTPVLMELNERMFVLPDGGTGIICIAEDITKRAKAEENLKNSEMSYRGLFNSTKDAIYIQDREGRFVDVNDGAVKMYGYPRSYFVGKTPEFLSAPGMNDEQQAYKMVQQAFKGKPQIFEFWGIDRSGRVFPKEVRLNIGKYFGKEVVIAFAQDITERKAAQKTLQESEKKYRKIFHAFPDIYFRSDINGIVREVSPSVKRITGFRPEEVIGRNSKMFYHNPDDWDKIGNVVAAHGKVEDFDTRIKVKKGSCINCSLTAVLNLDEKNQPIGVEGVLRDITYRKKTEETLKESQRMISTLMGNLPGMAYRCLNDKNWTMEYVSEGCLELTGYKSADLLGNRKVSFSNLIHPEDQEMVWNVVQQAVASHKSFRIIYRMFKKDRNLTWVWEQGIGIYSEDGNLISLEGFISNINDQKLAEEEMRKFSRAVEQSPTIVVITNLKGTIEYVNPKFTIVTGFHSDEVIKKNPRILKSGQTPEETYNSLWQTISAGKEWSGEFINKKKNGDIYWESAIIFPLKDDKGRITHFIAMKEDITTRKAMEQDLIKAKEKAEESDKLKSSFLANMSHEIRTPMNAIIGFSQLLSEPDIHPDEQFHFISLIQKSGGDLLGLIDDIIDISKIEAGQLKVFKSDYFVDAILTEVYESYIEYLRTTDHSKNIEFRYKNTDQLKKVVIHTDIDKLKQIVRNLLNNAIKYTDFGLIEFGAEIKNTGRQAFVEFYVRDTGIGIPNDKMDVIFESFRQLDVTNKRLYGGTGLGLAITKKIVEILGGEIWVNSTLGQGSTFYFKLPYNPLQVEGNTIAKRVEAANLKKNDWSKKHILIVEDDEHSFMFYQSVLNKTNIKISRAIDGGEAIALNKKEKFDLIMMDIRMPNMDGYETTGKILAINPKAKIIAQTAYALAGEKQRCLDAGCVDYIAKPIRIADFLKIIERYI